MHRDEYKEKAHKLGLVEGHIKEQVLTIILYRLDVPLTTFEGSLNCYIENEQTLAKISKVLLQLIDEDNKATFTEFKRKSKTLSK